MRGVPRGVRGPARPPLPRAAERLPGVRAAGGAGRCDAPGARRGGGGRRRCCATGRSSRSRASAATTSPAAPTTPRRSARAARAQAPRGQAVRADGRRRRRGARRSSSSARPRRRCWLAGAADRARAAARRARAWRRPSRPASRELGVMLPYSPLHHLLLADAGAPLVLTSGNVSDEPIAYRDDDALRAARADRRRVPRPRPPDPHRAPTTRSCASCAARPMVLRRSRGYVPGGAARCRSPARAPGARRAAPS